MSKLGNKLLNNKKNVLLIVFSIIFILILLFIPKFFKPNIETIKDSVVLIESYDKNGNLLGTGSGFCAYKSNYIVTNFHVIEGSNKLVITTDEDKKIQVENIVVFSQEDDLAIVEIDGELKPLNLGNGNKVKTKDKVTAIGSPLGVKNTISEGIVSNVDYEDEIRISVPISHGSSGGVLLDKNYKVIGITSSGYDEGQNLNFAINVNLLKDMYDAYIENEYKEITDSSLDACMPNSGDEITNYISCYNNYDYYTVSSLKVLNKLTNVSERYEYYIENSDWEYFYNDLNKEDKEYVISYFETINDRDFCYKACDIVGDIEAWDVIDFMINLNVLKKEELALVIADLDNYSSDNDKFNRVEEYYLEAYQKTLILYLIGDRDWDDIHSDNKRDIFDYFDSKYGTEELGAILEILGYDVVYENDGTLTAYW